jgi:uncharacterized short protein YbdD (DUF466 family)
MAALERAEIAPGNSAPWHFPSAQNNGTIGPVMTMKIHILNFWNDLWAFLRHLTGDDAYERYLAHWQATHANGPDEGTSVAFRAADGASGGADSAPLDRKAFFHRHQDEKWQKINRCC